MNPTSRVSQLPARARPAAAALLGADHPLVYDLERLALVRTQWLVVAAVFVGSVAAVYEGLSAAAALVVGAAVTQLLLGGRAVSLIESRRVHVLELISDGHTDLPIAVVERACVRLQRPRHRRSLMRRIDALLDAAVGPFDVVTTPWRFMRADLVRRELIEIRALLGGRGAGLPGLAMLERLLTDGTSSLHGDDPRQLRDDLHRVRFRLLASRG